MSDNISLSARYSRALTAASGLSAHSALAPEYKKLADDALADLRLVAAAINDLHLFSKNETIEDVSTRQLVYFSVPYTIAEVLQALPTTEPDSRKEVLTEAEINIRKFIGYLTDYEIIDDAALKSAKRLIELLNNPSQRREAKIQQYQAEKQLKTKIQALRSRGLRANADEPANNYEALRALLVTSSGHAGSVNEEDDDRLDEETLRELSTLLLKLLFAQANTSLLHISQELQLLQSMPSPVSNQACETDLEGDNTWRLDRGPPAGLGNQGPLLDSKGRPLRPFTIMPAGEVAERARLRQGVFRPDYRLPTMTIDEYLAEEERRGNVIRGGGQASEAAPTSSEQLSIDAEQDGTRFGEDKHEEQRAKEEEWAVYTDSNPKGMGNTMNRG